MNKIIIFIIFNILIGSSLSGQPSRIYLTGGPVFNNPIVNITEAGNNFINPTLASNSNTLIEIDDRKKANNWDVKVRLSQSIGNLTLDIIRTGNGTGNGSTLLTGGLNWISLGLTDVTMFSGKNDVQNVPVMFRIGGISVVDAVGAKSFNLVFTVVDR